MVKFHVTGHEKTDQAGGGLGWLSFQFQLNAEVIDTSTTGFTLVRNTLLPIPGATPIPDAAPDVYSGTDLQFTDITLYGTTLATPSGGVITSVTETGPNFTSTATGLNIDAADFFRVSATKNNRDNVDLMKQVFSGKDEFRGGSRQDKFNGFDGSDDMQGGGGNDRLWGGKGRDTIEGGSGDDKIWGENGKDRIDGGKGRDTIKGGNDNDHLHGGNGNDFIQGNKGKDRITGAAGDDTLEGGKGDDHLNGGGGRDVFVFNGGGLGNDTIENWVDGKDLIQIKHPTVDNLADVHVTQTADGVEVAYRDNTILILDTELRYFDHTDFHIL